MSEKLPSAEKIAADETTKDYQRSKGPTKIPGTAVFRSPYSVASKTSGCSPYYIMTTTGGIPAANASDEEKRRIMHNEVERKRKEKINKWIVRLCAIVPDCNGKQSKNCILEKTVNFIHQLTQENELPDDVKALKTEVIRLTERVESLSSENTHYLSLLKEAQNLSKGAWSLNMSIQRHKSDSTSCDAMEDGTTTMTPTLDRVNTGTGSNLTKIASAPNLPSLVGGQVVTTAQNVITLPIVAAPAPSGQSALSVVSGQPIQVPPSLLLSNVQNLGNLDPTHQVKVQPVTSTKMGSMVTALPGNPAVFTNSQPLLHQTPVVTSVPHVMANGQTFVANNGHAAIPQNFVANGHPVIANVQVKSDPIQTLKNNLANTGPSHSIQALLRDNTAGVAATTANNKTVYSIPTYLQTLQNGAGTPLYMAAQNTPIVAAQPQTPLLVHGENGPVVIMTPGSIPYFALPLNTMSTGHVMCEPTASSKGPLVVNQFPSLLNYTDSPVVTQSQPVQIGSVIQGPHLGQQSVVVGTQPVIGTAGQPSVMVGAQPVHMGTQPVMATLGAQTQPVMATLGAQTQPVMARLGAQTVLPTQQPTVVQQLQPAASTLPTMLQSASSTLPTMVGMQPVSTNTVLQVVNQGSREGTAAQLIQVPNSEGQQQTMLIPQSNAGQPGQQQTMLIPQSNAGQPTQCYIPVEVTMPIQVPRAEPTVVTVAPVPITNVTLTNSTNQDANSKNVTDFSISETYHGVPTNNKLEDSQVDEGDIYLSRNTSDASFSSDCFTPPYSSSSNVMLSSVNLHDTLSPGVEGTEGGDSKPLNHSIASLTGINPN